MTIQQAMELYSWVHGDKRQRVDTLVRYTGARVDEIAALVKCGKGAVRRAKRKIRND